MSERPKKLLQIDTNAKTVKGQKKGYLTGILYLAPARLSGYEVCPQRSKGCTQACLNTAGRGAFSNVQKARIAKTKWYFEDRQGFMHQLVKDIAALVRKAEREGMIPVVRLNGTSDIPWERVRLGHATVFDLFPNVQFYDYTKVTKRAIACAKGDFPANYKLTFSLTEDNDFNAGQVLRAGGNVAVVLRTLRCGSFPKAMRFVDGWLASDPAAQLGSFRVVDGDETDLRHLDPVGVIVGLKAKGPAKRDRSGFVR